MSIVFGDETKVPLLKKFREAILEIGSAIKKGSVKLKIGFIIGSVKKYRCNKPKELLN